MPYPSNLLAAIYRRCIDCGQPATGLRCPGRRFGQRRERCDECQRKRGRLARAAASARHYHANPEPHRRASRRRRLVNPEKFRARDADGRAAQADVSYALAGSVCQHCGETDPATLGWHHSKVGGKKNGGYPKELQGTGSYLPRPIIAYFKEHGCLPEGFELLCANCHKHANAALRDLQPLKRPEALRWRLDRRTEMCALFGNACPCGCGDLFVLELHHSNGGGHGAKHSGYLSYPPELRRFGAALVTGIVRYVEDHRCLPPDIELLCANCHARLGRGRPAVKRTSAATASRQ